MTEAEMVRRFGARLRKAAGEVTARGSESQEQSACPRATRVILRRETLAVAIFLLFGSFLLPVSPSALRSSARADETDTAKQAEVTRKGMDSADSEVLLRIGIPAEEAASGSASPDPADEPTLPAVRTLAFSRDGRFLAICGEPADPRLPRRIRIFDARDGHAVVELETLAAQVVSLEFSPDGKRLLSVVSDHPQGAAVWEMPGGRRVRSLPGGNGTAIFVEDGSRVAVADRFGTIDIVRVYEVTNGREVQRFPVETSYRQQFGPRGDILLAVRSVQAKACRVIDLATGKERSKLLGSRVSPRELRLSPDARTVAAGDGNDVLVWEMATGNIVHRLTGHTGRVLRIAFSPDGSRLVSGSADRGVRVWELATGRELHHFEGHDSIVSAVAFSGDGERLATGSFDRTVLVRDMRKTRRTFLAKAILDEAALQSLWHELGSEDSAVAYRALGIVALDRDQTLDWLDRRVESLLVPVRHEQIDRLIRELGDADYVIRQRATRALRKLKDIARPALLKSLRDTDSAEVRYRARRILADAEKTPRFTPADIRRMLRIVHAAENAGDEPSQRILSRIVDEFPIEDVRQAAERALRTIRDEP